MSNSIGGWGGRSALGGTIRALEDLKGNQDGLWRNEDSPANTTGSLVDRQPLLLRTSTSWSVGLSRRDEVARLQEFRETAEAGWGTKVVAPEMEAQLKTGPLYAAQKAIALSRLGRHPSEVTELFLHSKGSVMGEAMAGHKLFAQHWAPTAEPLGVVIPVSPGFQEGCRNFEDLIQVANAAGLDVLVFDPQWMPNSEGSAGGIDRGFGVALDASAALVEAQKLADTLYPKTGKVIALGNSMGGGPGIASALTLAAHGQITQDAGVVPSEVDAVLTSPFFKPSPSLLNGTLEAASHLPVINDIALPSAGVPVLTRDPVAAQKTAQDAVLGNTRAQLSAMSAAGADLDLLFGMLDKGQLPAGHFHILHPNQDPVADPAASRRFAELVGGEFTSLNTNAHTVQQQGEFIEQIVAAIKAMASRPASQPVVD